MSVAEPTADKSDDAIASSTSLNGAARFVFVVCTGNDRAADCRELVTELVSAGTRHAVCLRMVLLQPWGN